MITITAANIVVGDNRRNCVILTQFLLVRSKQGLGWDRVCEAQRSNESPSGAFKWQSGLRQ